MATAGATVAMARTCTVCTHAERAAIDLLLVNGGSGNAVAAKYRVSEDAVVRHRARHLPAALAVATEAAAVARADDLLGQVRDLQGKALGILAKAERAGDLRTALGAIREARGNLELLAKLIGQLDERPVVNLLVAPEYIAVRTRLLVALAPYPEARIAAAEALSAAD